ncbi:MAG: hypothetical protein D6760_04065 [Deltaproteobacteria bacterium]|nr:MAG: hypothetical protein D6760_04065 [Deltaproteobacteria bacterium]
MNLLAFVTQALSRRNIPYALIGGVALAAHGVARGTLDVDILVLADEALEGSTWQTVEAAGARVDVRRGGFGAAKVHPDCESSHCKSEFRFL